ncbi:hypothetical protein [Fibrella aestuarina]|uniref:hypothetical protein n=1 Tax=Fibrella aestuarina TaxID=651143 RepID=UPI00059B6765|nr:hypothetical protein [Fibrella aestuarina]
MAQQDLDTMVIEATFIGQTDANYVNGKIYEVQLRDTPDTLAVGKAIGHWRYYKNVYELLAEWANVSRSNEPDWL